MLISRSTPPARKIVGGALYLSRWDESIVFNLSVLPLLRDICRRFSCISRRRGRLSEEDIVRFLCKNVCTVEDSLCFHALGHPVAGETAELNRSILSSRKPICHWLAMGTWISENFSVDGHQKRDTGDIIHYRSCVIWGISTNTAAMPGFDYKFLEKPKRRFQCPLCSKAMREPVQVSTCGHRFCDTCLQEFLR